MAATAVYAHAVRREPVYRAAVLAMRSPAGSGFLPPGPVLLVVEMTLTTTAGIQAGVRPEAPIAGRRGNSLSPTVGLSLTHGEDGLRGVIGPQCAISEAQRPADALDAGAARIWTRRGRDKHETPHDPQRSLCGAGRIAHDVRAEEEEAAWLPAPATGVGVGG